MKLIALQNTSPIAFCNTHLKSMSSELASYLTGGLRFLSAVPT